MGGTNHSLMKQLQLILSGRVQHVGYRNFVLRGVQKIPEVTGYVRNNSEGTLEVLLEGDEKILQKIIDYVEQGPPSADIEDVKESWKEITKREFTQFEML